MSRLKELLNKYEISPRKSLGQHFVVDPNTIQRILRFAFDDTHSGGAHSGGALPVSREPGLVIEIGAGLGALTLGLADKAQQVIAIETDQKLIPALREVLSEKSNVELIHSDALTLDFATLDFATLDFTELSDSPNAGCRLVANLPYNIATRLILKILQEAPFISELTVMVQKEVAGRFLAKPGDSTFGLVSLKAQFYARITSGGKISPNVFYPKPAVDSELLKLVRSEKSVSNPELIFELATAAFQKRRKMLRRSLVSVAEPEHFEAAKIPPSARPQELGIYDWDRLALALSQKN